MHLTLVIARWGAALACFILTLVKLLQPVLAPNEAVLGVDFSKAWPLLLAFGFLIGGLICIAPELVHWGSIPIRVFMENLFYPNDRSVPPPDCTLARLYAEQGRFDEALAEYRMMVANHPEEFPAYVEAIKLAFEIGQPKVAEKFFKRGMSKIGSEEFQTYLQSVYKTAKTRPRGSEIRVRADVSVEIEALLAERRQRGRRVWRDNPNL